MFKGDDEEEDDGNIPIVKYPCMPSLVALQQMRNRLHLARLGKKLMKWTALATGRELRRLAEQILETHKDLRDDMSAGFMLLARGRYFYPNLNQMVLENADREAMVTVVTSTRTIAGVKIIHLDIRESGSQPYAHLGIDKGGESIHEAKVAWLKLLKRIILMVEQRTSFQQVESASKTATKRKNVLQKIIIPKIKKTIKYILDELEELAREELYRIKKIKKNKIKQNRKIDYIESGFKCPVCAARRAKMAAFEKEQKSVASIDLTRDESNKSALHKIEEKSVVTFDLSLDESKKTIVEKIGKEEKPVVSIESSKEESKKSVVFVKELETRIEQVPVSKEKVRSQISLQGDVVTPLSSEPKNSRGTLDSKSILSIGASNINIRLNFLKNQLNQMICLSGNLLRKGLNMNLKDFFKTCEDAKWAIEHFFKSKQPTTSVDEQMKIKLNNLKYNLKEVIEGTHELRNKSLLCPSVEQFIKICENVDDKLNMCLKMVESKVKVKDAKDRLKELKRHIDNVIDMTEHYKNEKPLTPSVENFLISCKIVAFKIDRYLSDTDEIDKENVNALKKLASDFEHLHGNDKQKDIDSSSLENFITSCKGFKVKIGEYKKKDKIPPTEGDLDKLINNIGDVLELTRDAEEKGFMPDSVESFIKSCEDIKKKLESKSNTRIHTDNQPKSLNDLLYNIDDIMNIVTECKEHGLVTQSVEDFINSCKNAKSKASTCEKCVLGTGSEGRMLYAACSKTCTCDNNEQLNNELCDQCLKLIKEESSDDQLSEPPCDFCRGILKEESSEEIICRTCNGIPLEEDTSTTMWPEYVSPKNSQEHVCSICENHKKEGGEEEMKGEKNVESIENTELVDTTLGYFEKKMRKITRIKRTQNVDGTILEEKETIIVRKERHDPRETSMIDNDDDFDDDCYDSIIDHTNEDAKNIGICISKGQDQRGFTKFLKDAKSETVTRSPTICDPRLRQCISEDIRHRRAKSTEASCTSKYRSELVQQIFTSDDSLEPNETLE